MKKEDCEIGMFVVVIKNVNPLGRNRLKIKRIGEIVGVYDSFVNLQLFDSNITDIEQEEPIIINKKLYIESFEFAKIKKIQRKIIHKEE